MPQSESIGASALPDGSTRFRVWAPLHEKVQLRLVNPEAGLHAMTRDDRGYHSVSVAAVGAGARYFFRVGKDDRPDPASRSQPDGVHGASEVVSTEFTWNDDDWGGMPLREYVVYELHVGTFTEAGTLDAAIRQLDRLQKLGITVVELMPVAQFPGSRNWGYDGVYPNAVQDSYGGPAGLKRFVNAAHARGLAVVLDVVYNHLGPEGNYFGVYGPYSTDFYKTPWGSAMNFAEPGSDEVRNFFISNALQWIDEFHIDGLRLDAVHAILDFSARPFLRELAAAVQERAERLRRRVVLIAESELNDPRLILPPTLGGFGLDAQWADDLHHALHVTLTGESSGYYGDFSGVTDLAEIMENGWLYRGQYSPVRRRRYGAPTTGLHGSQFVVCIQNHDQVGNRMMGDRLASTLSVEKQKVALATVILSPFTPMLFMGEEYSETAPFQYFTSHGDPELVEAVRKGRREEFAAFAWEGEVPDPHAVGTFENSRVRYRKHEIEDFARELIALRSVSPALRNQELTSVRAFAFDKEQVLLVLRRDDREELAIIFVYSDRRAELSLPIPAGQWQRAFTSSPAGAETVASDGAVTVNTSGASVTVYRRKG